MKRLLSVILTISIVLGSCGAAFAEEFSELIPENEPQIIEEEFLPEEIEEDIIKEDIAPEEETITEEVPAENLPEEEKENLTEELTEENLEETDEENVLPEGTLDEEVEEIPPAREYDQSVIDFINNNPINVGLSANSNQMSTMGEITNVDNVELMEEEIELEKDETAELNATTNSVATTSSTVPEEFTVDPVSSPYFEYINDNEGVSLATGAMTYNKTLLSLPGRNGLDLNISVNYNSQNAVITENEYTKTRHQIGTIKDIDFTPIFEEIITAEGEV